MRETKAPSKLIASDLPAFLALTSTSQMKIDKQLFVSVKSEEEKKIFTSCVLKTTNPLLFEQILTLKKEMFYRTQ